MEQADRILDFGAGLLITHGGGRKMMRHGGCRGQPRRERVLKEQTRLSRVHKFITAWSNKPVRSTCNAPKAICIGAACQKSSSGDPRTLQPMAPRQRGIIQTISVLPSSYPGHNLLTEDEGLLCGADGCPCGRRGTYFRVLGRLNDAEPKGCADADPCRSLIR